MPPKKKKSKKKKSSKKIEEPKDLSDPKIQLEEQLRRQKALESELRLAEEAKERHRTNADVLARANLALESSAQQTERETIEVIAFLKTELAKQSDELRLAREEAKEAKRQARVAIEDSEHQCAKQIETMEQFLHDRESEITVLKEDVASLREFRVRRDKLEQELQNAKESLVKEQQRHEQHVQQLETKFYEEKALLTKQFQQELESLAQHAERQALDTLDASQQLAFQENARLTKAVKVHAARIAALEQEKSQSVERMHGLEIELQSKNQLLETVVEKETKQRLKAEKLGQQNDDLQSQLNTILKQHQVELSQLRDEVNDEQKSLRSEIQQLQRLAATRQSELRRVRKLARNVLEQRTCVEQMLIESIQELRNEATSHKKSSSSRSLSSTTPLPGIKAKAGGLNQELQERIQIIQQALDAVNNGQSSSAPSLSNTLSHQMLSIQNT